VIASLCYFSGYGLCDLMFNANYIKDVSFLLCCVLPDVLCACCCVVYLLLCCVLADVLCACFCVVCLLMCCVLAVVLCAC
jgi:hypothetical protein